MQKRHFFIFAGVVLSAVAAAACTVTVVDDPYVGADTGIADAGDARTDATDAADASDASDAAKVYASCEACRDDLCTKEFNDCRTVLSGETESPCKGFESCVSPRNGEASCIKGCTDAYPEADAYYGCLTSKCATNCTTK